MSLSWDELCHHQPGLADLLAEAKNAHSDTNDHWCRWRHYFLNGLSERLTALVGYSVLNRELPDFMRHSETFTFARSIIIGAMKDCDQPCQSESYHRRIATGY